MEGRRDEYRCTTTLTPNHHLQHILSPHSTTPLVPQTKKRGRPPTLASPNNTPLPSDRCTRNDGKGWRCPNPRLPGNRFCDKHDKYIHRGRTTKQKHHHHHRPSPTVLMPPSEEENLVEASAQANIAAVVSTSMPLPLTVPNSTPATQTEKPRVVKIEAETLEVAAFPTVPPGFTVIECRPQPPTQEEKKPMLHVKETSVQVKIATVASPSMSPSPTTKVDEVPKSTPATQAEKPPVVKEVASPTMPVEKPPVVNVNLTKSPPKTFRVGEVWALPASPGGPPRAYARIERIIHSSGQAEVTLLAPHPISNEEIEWAEDGRTLACGTFRATSHPRVINISSLSHRIAYSEVGKSFFKILPRAGEVWAVYDGLEMGSAYHLAEIMSGFTKEGGATAARLVLAEGGHFKRELHGQYDLRRTFLRKDLLWFSHRVLAVKTAKDAAGCGGQWKVFS